MENEINRISHQQQQQQMTLENSESQINELNQVNQAPIEKKIELNSDNEIEEIVEFIEEEQQEDEEIEYEQEEQEEEDIPLPPAPPGLPPPPAMNNLQSTANRMKKKPNSIQRRVTTGNLEEELAQRRQNLITVPTVVKQTIRIDPLSDMEQALKKRREKSNESIRDKITLLVQQLNEPFQTFKDLLGFLTKVKELEDAIHKADGEWLRSIGWSQTKIDNFKLVANLVRTIRQSIDNANSVIKMPKMDHFDLLEKSLIDLNRNEQRFVEVEQFNQYHLPINARRLKEITDETTINVIKRAILLIDMKSDRLKQTTGKTKFDLKFRVKDTTELIHKTLTLISRQIITIRQQFINEIERLQSISQQLGTNHASILGVVTLSNELSPNSVSRQSQLHEAVKQGRIDEVLSTIDNLKSSLSNSQSTTTTTTSTTEENVNDGNTLLDKSTPIVCLTNSNQSNSLNSVQDMIEQTDRSGKTPLELAILAANIQLVRILIEKGALIKRAEGLSSYLHIACSVCSPAIIEVIDFLIENGSELNARNTYGSTPLHVACFHLNYLVIERLIQLKADLFAKDWSGRSPLDNLVLKGFPTNEIKLPQYSIGLSLGRYLNNQQLSDIRFNIKGTIFYAHRLILSCQSRPLSCMLEGNQWKESGKDEIELIDISPTVFGYFLQFCYTGDISFNDISATLELYSLANRFLHDQLIKSCEYILFKHLNLENAYAIYTQATLFNCHSLIHETSRFILMNYELIEFADIKNAILFDILKRTSLK